LSGKPTPEGILYSGGRDGQVLAHELGISLKQRSKPYGIGSDGKGPIKSWEAITGWGDLEENIEEEQVAGNETSISFEDSWELDPAVKEPSSVSILL
jgi:WD repeat-containing protein 48